MTLQWYKLDQIAHELVYEFREKEALNQAHKMRTTVAFGLERFWGEPQRLKGEKAEFWRKTWEALHSIMGGAGINLPTQSAEPKDLWNFPVEQRKVALAVLTQLCDAIVWWTQRYKKNNANEDDSDE
jgi:hypothetical protein